MTSHYQSYNNFLHSRIKAWGIEYPYQFKPIMIAKSLQWNDKKEKSQAIISLFTLNKYWGYCISIHTKKGGTFYGPFLNFCKPYPSRRNALYAAYREICQKNQNKKLIKWAEKLHKPKQLKLF